MKKIGLYILFLTVLVGNGSKVNSGDPSQDSMIFKTAQVAQSINDFDNSLVFIMLLVTLIFVLLFGLVVCSVIVRMIRNRRIYQKFISSKWIEDSDIHARKVEETDLNLAMFTEQQWSLSELFSQGHEDGDCHDFVDLPRDW